MSDRIIATGCPAPIMPALRLQGFWDAILMGWRGVQTRRQLAEMDERMLADIGISRADALREAGRAPWDLRPPMR